MQNMFRVNGMTFPENLAVGAMVIHSPNTVSSHVQSVCVFFHFLLTSANHLIFLVECLSRGFQRIAHVPNTWTSRPYSAAFRSLEVSCHCICKLIFVAL